MQKYNLPLDTSTDYDLFCINGHLIGNTKVAIPIEVFLTLLTGVFSPVNLVGMISLSTAVQAFARDFILLKRVKDRYITTYKDKEPRKGEDYLIFGQPIYSIGNGEVVSVNDGEWDTVGSDIIKPLGNYVVIKHDTFLYATYAHMQNGSVKVKVGDEVTAKQIIGKVGTSGNSTEPHLHFHLAKTNQVYVPLIGMLGVPAKVDIFTPFKAADLIDKEGIFLNFLKSVTGVVDYDVILKRIESAKSKSVIELPHLGIISESNVDPVALESFMKSKYKLTN